jgi:flagella basal body P-ring formation protein FlgA
MAAAPADLKARPVSHGANVTLGDVLDGVEGPAAAIVIAPAAPSGLDAVLDADTVRIAAKRAGYDWPNASGFRRIIVSSEAGVAPTQHVKLLSGRHGKGQPHANQALTYARNVMAGDILAAQDFVWSDDAAAPLDAVANPDLALGKAARHALRAGAPVAAHDLMSARVIKRDDIVAVVFEDEGVNLTLQGKALGDCSVGDSLDVINPQSKKVIQTVCTGPDQAAVGPRADQIKAENNQTGDTGRFVRASLR